MFGNGYYRFFIKKKVIGFGRWILGVNFGSVVLGVFFDVFSVLIFFWFLIGWSCFLVFVV